MALSEPVLKEIFVTRTGLLSEDEYDNAVKLATQNRIQLDRLLMERSFVSQRYYLELIGNYFNAQVAELSIGNIDLEVMTMIPELFATSNNVLLFEREDNVLHMAMSNPHDQDVIDTVMRITGHKVKAFVATDRAIQRAMLLYHGGIRGVLGDLIKKAGGGEAATNEGGLPDATTLVSALVDAALLLGASDIHIEPYEHELIIRLRVDGELRSVATFPKIVHPTLIARLKVMAGLRLDERRIPQDGRFSVKLNEQQVDLRISLVPSMWGEKPVMRVLAKEANFFDIANIGLMEHDLALIRSYLKKPYGMIIVCGPTGAGKTTTLYAFLQEIGLDKIDVVNVSTIEDPIEYTVARITQIPIQPDVNLTFAAGLRALLRQDPDIIMVGEVRDEETADIAVRAALVGRLLLTSLHANTSLGAIPRLLDMGIEPYLVVSALSLVITQRLVRKLCPHCRESYIPDKDAYFMLNNYADFERTVKVLARHGIIADNPDAMRGMRFFRAKGCVHCDNTGYHGRVALFEILEVSDRLREAVTHRKDIATLQTIVEEEGMKTLLIDGYAKVILGITDLKEVLRVAL
jgi:type IV pilus assembly protein PilB